MATGSAGTEDVAVKFGANIDDIKDKMSELGGLLGGLAGKFAAVAAVAAGGAAFKSFIDETLKLNSEALQLSRILGITAEEAGTLNTALGDIGADADTYSGAFLKFSRALKTNSEQLRALGVDTDAVKSGQKTSNEVFVESLGLLQAFKPGIDQAQFASTAFGRSIGDVQKLQKLFGTETERTIKTINEQGQEVTRILTPLEAFNRKQDEAREKNLALNLTITTEGLAATRKYKEAIRDAGDVLSGIKNTIGNAVIPIFTELSRQFATAGPAIIQAIEPIATTAAAVLGEVIRIFTLLWETVSDVVRSIGDAITSVFGGESISAIDFLKNTLAILHASFIALRIGVQIVCEAIKTSLQLLGSSLQSVTEVGAAAIDALIAIFEVAKATFTTFYEVASAALHLDFDAMVDATQRGASTVVSLVSTASTGLADAWGKGAARQEEILSKSFDKMTEIATKGRDQINAALMGGGQQAQAKTPADKPQGTGDKTFDVANDAMSKARLQLQRASADAALALQLEQLKQASAIYDTAYKQDLITIKQFYDAKQAIETKAIDLTIGNKQRELGAVRQEAKAPGVTDTKKTEYAAQEAKILGEINVLEAQRTGLVRKNTAEYEQAERDRTDKLTDIKLTSAKAAVDSETAIEKGGIDMMRTLGQISADQALEMERGLEQRKYEVAKEGLAKRFELAREDVVKRAQIQAEMERLEQENQQRITAIDRAQAVERSKYQIQANQSIRGSFTTLLNDLMDGKKRLGDAFRDFALGVAKSIQGLIAQKFSDKLFESMGGNKVIDMLVKPFSAGIDMIVQAWIGKEATQAAVTEAGAAQRIATDEAAGAATLATQQAEGVAGVLSYASLAATAAMASVAAIPFTGWAMAPEVGAATYATALGYLASAEGGWWQIPHDQVAQVHRNEMVLPAAEAQGIRDMVSGGGATKSKGDTFNLSFIDAAGGRSFIQRHSKDLAAAARKEARNFTPGS